MDQAEIHFKNLGFLSKSIGKSSDQVTTTQSYHSLQNFKVVLLSQRATGRPTVPV